MRIADFDYTLPETAIAQTPAEPRDSSRMLHLDLKDGHMQHYCFNAFPSFLKAGDLLVMNDSKVSALRLFGRKETGGQVEALVLAEKAPALFEAMVRPAKRLMRGTRIQFEEGLTALVEAETPGGLRLLRFESSEDLGQQLQRIGRTPLPPYITNFTGNPDRYQTVYSKSPGSAAAPTAGLHFTPEIIAEIRTRGVRVEMVSLNVSIDTFRPVQSDEIADHKMHGEDFVISERVAEAVGRCEGRVIAVGTTTVRALESAATGTRRVNAGAGRTDIFIAPGYKFKAVDGMLTNFHMPRTTMMLLISALAGRENVLRAYNEALTLGYRFLSFGDCMLILRSEIDA